MATKTKSKRKSKKPTKKVAKKSIKKISKKKVIAAVKRAKKKIKAKKPTKKKKKDPLLTASKGHKPPEDLTVEIKPGVEPKGDNVPEATALDAEVYEGEDGLGDQVWYVEYNRIGKTGRNTVRLDAESLSDAKFEAASLLGIAESDIRES